MTRLKHFSTAVAGRTPEKGSISGLTVCGKKVDPARAHEVAHHLAGPSVTPVNILAAVGAAKITVAVPGGRDPSELARSQVEGRVAYRPVDMFGSEGPKQ